MKNFFAKNKIVIITVVAILLIAILAYLFKDDIKSLFSKKANSEDIEALKKEIEKKTDSPAPKEPSANTEIGKRAYANSESVKVLFKADASTFKVKNKNEFIGVVSGITTLAGSPFYVVGNGIVVAKSKVYLK